jgi:DNA polymerase
MSEDFVNLAQKYLQTRIDLDEEGFWIDTGENKELGGKSSISSSVDEQVSLKKDNNKIKMNNEKGKTKTGKGSVLSRFNVLEEEVKGCRKCPLGSVRINACFGNGNVESKIMFIGEGPGYEEDHKGMVFIGRAGKLLEKIIETTLGLKRSEVYITNIVKCHPMKDPSDPEKRGNDRAPVPAEVKACFPYLIEQINLIKPKVIVTLGSPASKTMLDTDKGITSIRGKIFDVKYGDLEAKLVPTYHPAYLLRNPPKKSEMYEDTKVIKSLL